MQPAFADIVWAQSRGSLCSGCEIGDDEGDIVNIINSRSDDEGRHGAARIINTVLFVGSLTRKCVSTFSLPFCFPPCE